MSETVLVVDDREVNLELIQGYLEEVGCEVVTATTGVEALRMIAAQPPDLVLLDVMMPGLDGFDVCRQIKGRTHLLPVVLVTALSQSLDRVRGLDAGADDFITKPVERIELVARVRSLLRLKAMYDRLEGAEQVILSLARAVEAKDRFTESHTERVGQSARLLGTVAGLDEKTVQDLYLGGAIHDIGKIGIPDSILLKAGALSVEERDFMRQHVTIGEQIVSPLKSASTLIPIVRHHHERYDGGGYPDRLAGTAIPLPARIMAVCDSYDAMTNARPYRPALVPRHAARIMREGAGTQWDPKLVEMFISQVLRTEDAGA